MRDASDLGVIEEEPAGCVAVQIAEAAGEHPEGLQSFHEAAVELDKLMVRLDDAAAVRQVRFDGAAPTADLMADLECDVRAVANDDWCVYCESWSSSVGHSSCPEGERSAWARRLEACRAAWARSAAPLVEFARRHADSVSWVRLSGCRAVFLRYDEARARERKLDIGVGADGRQPEPGPSNCSVQPEFAAVDREFEAKGMADAAAVMASVVRSDDAADAEFVTEVETADEGGRVEAALRWGRLRGEFWRVTGDYVEHAWSKGFAAGASAWAAAQ